MPARTRQHRSRHATAITIAMVVAMFLLLVLLYYSSENLVARVIIALMALAATGMTIALVNRFQGAYGMYIVGGHYGIRTIESMARHRAAAWEFFAQVGMVMGFGLLSYFIFRKQISKLALLAGLALIAILLFVIYPYFLLSFQFIKLPNGSTLAGVSPAQFQLTLTLYILYALALLGGFSLFIGVLLLIGAGSIVFALFTVAKSVVTQQPVNVTVLTSQSPGVEPVLPGLTIPFTAGVLALALLLIVHEFSHGILSTVYKTKVKKVGLVLFGVVPIGAFVEPDEKKVKRLSALKQNRIFIAGVSANFLFTFVFFVLTFIMLNYVMPNLNATQVIVTATVPGSSAFHVIPVGSAVLAWNGQAATSMSALQSIARNDAPYSIVSVSTTNGTYSLKTNATGKIGVELEEQQTPVTSGTYYNIVELIYQFVVLSFALNFLVATINLLPLPSFDGWRIYKNAVRNPRTLRLLSLFIVALLLILALPWIWTL